MPPRIGIVSLSLATLLAAGCAHQPKRPLSPLGQKHAREGFRGVLAGSAIVLPVLDCDARAAEVEKNDEARQKTQSVFAAEVWRQLQLPGAPEDGRVDESDVLCEELSQSEERGTNVTLVSPAMREQLRNYFNRYPDKHWLVAVVRALGLDGTRETAQVALGAYVFSDGGEVAFRGDLKCDPQAQDKQASCGEGYGFAQQRVGELLDGFPMSILGDAKIVSAQPPEPAPAQPAAPAPAAAPAHKKARHRRR